MRHHELKPFQREALQILQGHGPSHVLCMAPTGAGKSLIFETLAQSPNQTTLIVSPLRALIRQQESRLEELGVRIEPGLRRRSTHGCTPLAWVTTPEQLIGNAKRGFRPPIDTLLVVDECHCVEEWGPGFRPEFKELPSLPSRWGLRRSLWLSATLTPAALEELEAHLPWGTHRIGGFGLHPSLSLSRFRIPLRSRLDFISRWLEVRTEPGILFCSSRKSCEEMGRLLEGMHGRSAGTYHAGLVREERLAIERRADDGSLRWLAATSAFGMGMNFPHFEWVVLCEPPYTVLSLAQMLGRCGRSPMARPRGAVLWDPCELERLEKLHPREGARLRSFFESPMDPEEWLRKHFS